MGTLMTFAGGFTPEAFRVSWLVMYPVWIVALVGIVVVLAALLTRFQK